MYLHVFFVLNECEFPSKTKLHFPLKSAKSLRNGTPVCSPGHVSRLEINLVQSGAKKKTLLQDFGMYGTYMSFSYWTNVSFPQKQNFTFPLKSAKSLREMGPCVLPWTCFSPRNQFGAIWSQKKDPFTRCWDVRYLHVFFAEQECEFPSKTKLHFSLKSAKSLGVGPPAV